MQKYFPKYSYSYVSTLQKNVLVLVLMPTLSEIAYYFVPIYVLAVMIFYSENIKHSGHIMEDSSGRNS